MKPIIRVIATMYISAFQILDYYICRRCYSHQKHLSAPFKLASVLGFCILSLCQSTALYSQDFLHGTTVIAICNFDSVTIGADSRKTSVSIDGSIVTPDTACKVFSSQNFILGITGIAKGRMSPTSDTCFDLATVFRYFSNRDTSLTLLAKDCYENMCSVFVRFLSIGVQTREPFICSALLDSTLCHQLGLEFLIAGIIHDSIALCHAEFNVEAYDPITHSLYYHYVPLQFFCPSRDSLPEFLPIGHIDSILPLDLRRLISEVGFTSATNMFITAQAHKRPDAVGGSIDIVKLYRDGRVSWIQRKKNCCSQ